MKNLLLYSLLAVTMLIATALRSAEIIPVWHKVNESGGIHDMEFLRGEDEFIMIAGVGELGEIQVRETLTGELVKSFPLHSLSYDNQIEITPDSTRFVLSTGGDPKLKTSLELRSLEDFHLIKSMYFELGKDTIDDEGNHYHSKLNQLVIDPVRPYVYAIYEKQNRFGNLTPLMLWLKVYNYETMEEVKDLTPVGYEKEQLKCIDVSDDGRYLAALNNGKAYLKVWDLQTMEQIRNVQLWDDKLPDYDWECEAKDIEFSSINDDVIYFSGKFPEEQNLHADLRKYNISTNESYDLWGTSYGKLILFDNEDRVYFNSGGNDQIFLNKNNKLLLEADNELLDFPSSMKVIFSDMYNIFIGTSIYNSGAIKYDFQTDVKFIYDEEITISPNPTGSFVNISLNCTEPQINYQINNSNGLLLLQNSVLNQGNSLQIDFSTYPVGVYFLTLNCNNQPKTYKIIKEG